MLNAFDSVADSLNSSQVFSRPISLSMASIHVLSSQISTLPEIPELYNPNFLDLLIPAVRKQPATRYAQKLTEKPSAAGSTGQAPRNIMMEALQSTAHRTWTDNHAPAYSSTLSPTLDAFQGLSNAKGYEFKTYLDTAWAEDPALTLRIIWSTRSIPDGIGNKDVFYRYGALYKYPISRLNNKVTS